MNKQLRDMNWMRGYEIEKVPQQEKGRDGREEIFKRKCRQFSRIKKCHDFSDRKCTLNTKQNKISLHVDTS